MKALSALLLFVATCSTVFAETAEPAPTPTPSKKAGFNLFNLGFNLEDILTSGPIASFISKTGVNITEKVAEAKKAAAETGWHPDIPLITDENINELVYEEKLTPAEEEKRVWFLVVSVPKGDSMTKFADEKFDAAFNLTQSPSASSLPHVKWGRINYMTVTRITTRWWIWKAPVIVVLTKRGQELRFYSPRTLNMKPETMLRFLEVEAWKQTPAWSGLLAPGGAWSNYMDFVADKYEVLYNYVIKVPSWILLLVGGSVTFGVISFLHKTAPPPAAPPAAKPKAPRTRKSETKEAREVKKLDRLSTPVSDTGSASESGSIKKRSTRRRK